MAANTAGGDLFGDGTELPEIYDFLLKFILISPFRCVQLDDALIQSCRPYIGDSSVGKSCLMHYFLNGRLRDPSPHTIGVEFSSTLLRLPSTSPGAEVAGTRMSNSKTLKVQIWDTAGQERFRSVTRNYYRGACGAVIVYDITSRPSFESLDSWLADARALASPDLAIVLVGNKMDQAEYRQVPYLEASRWAKEHDVLFMETSSLTGENIEQPFVLLARQVLLGIESGEVDPEKAGSGVSYGERTLKRVTSWGSSLTGTRPLKGTCC